MNIRSGLRRVTLLAGLALGLCLASGAAAPALAGVPGDDSVLLDPFDPVPQIGFSHPDCFDPCGYRRCEHYCGRPHRPRCDELCWELYWAHKEALRRYWRQSNMYDMLINVYMDELRAYDITYLDGKHFRELWHKYGVGLFHDGPPPDYDGPPPEFYRDGGRDWHGDGDGHDGDGHDGNGHDGDHRDADHHDADGHDGDHHDGDQHDGDWHDGDQHDGDHHDGDRHDGHDGDHDGDRDGPRDGWYDQDGHWHDGPPPPPDDGHGH
ncbi:MAG TPA: hypothetical protein VMH86_06410 [Rhizomicrobium sp.]|nr:hypothetical protein [Rhizomicrobium sp.]